jgi:hypothetical protein
MTKQFNSTLVEPFEAPSKAREYKESTHKSHELSWDEIKEKAKSYFTKELVFMLSVSTAWFIAFLYFVLYVFT